MTSNSLGQTGSCFCMAAAQWEHLLLPLHLGFPRYNMKGINSPLPPQVSCKQSPPALAHPALRQTLLVKMGSLWHFHEQCRAQCRKLPAQPQPTCSFLLPEMCLSVTILASTAAGWWIKSFSINTANFISTATYKTLGAIKLCFYLNFL